MTSARPVRVRWPEALAFRLTRHGLDPLGSGRAADVVRRLAAVPAMDTDLARLAVALRQRDPEPDGLREAVRSGEVVRVFAFRGAAHFLSARDGGTYLALRAAGRQWERTSWVEYYRLTAADWVAFRAAVRDALDEGPLTVPELGAAVTRRRAYRHLRPVFEDDPWTLLKALTWQGDMTFGESRDGSPTFRRLDTDPSWGGIPPLEVAGPAAVTAYLRTYGPATPDHLQYWLGAGLSAGRARVDRWFEAVRSGLAEVDVDGVTAYVLEEDLEDLRRAEPSDAVRLLPGHDPWVMGPGTADEHVVPPDLREAVTRRAGLVVVGGVVRGTWRRRRDEVELTWPGRPAAGRAEVAAEVAEVARMSDVLGEELRPAG